MVVGGLNGGAWVPATCFVCASHSRPQQAAANHINNNGKQEAQEKKELEKEKEREERKKRKNKKKNIKRCEEQDGQTKEEIGEE